MAPREVEQPRLKDQHPDLHDKLKLMPVSHWTTSSAKLTLDDMKRGLDSSSGPEFLSRCFVRKGSYEAFRDSVKIKDGDSPAAVEKKTAIREAVLHLVDTPEGKDRVHKAFVDVVGGSIGPLPKHPLRWARLGKFFSTEEGISIYEKMYKHPYGSEMMADFGMSLDAAHVMRWISRIGGDFILERMIEAKVEGHIRRPKIHTDQIWGLARVVNTSHIHEGITDEELRGVLTGQDRNKAFEVIAEFFSTSEKYERFMSFTGDVKNRRLLGDVMADDPARTVLSFSDVLKTPGAVDRFADAIVKRNDIICHIGGNPIKTDEPPKERTTRQLQEASEEIFSVFNAPDYSGKEIMKKVIRTKGGKMAGVKIVMAVAGMRVRHRVGGLGDIPLPEETLESVRAHRQAVM
ncbi:MAG: hypothetical protein V1703_02815 [Candidatus Altiarchaeota archaeon]